MCIVAYLPPNIRPTKNIFRKMYLNNGDGCGMAYPDDAGEKVIIERGLFGFRKFWRKFRDISREKPVLVHFRISTSGRINEENCHPWEIDERHALVHNGNIKDKLDEELDEISDTGVFVKTILKPLFSNPQLKDKTFWASASFKWLMESTMGCKNKMAIIDAGGLVTIFNEAQGEWTGGAWYSNTSYKEDRKPKEPVTRTENGVTKEVSTSTSGVKETTKYFPATRLALLPPKKTNSDSATASVPNIITGREFDEILSQHPLLDIANLV